MMGHLVAACGAVEAILALLDVGGTDAAVRFAEAEAALDSTAPGAGGVLCLPWLAGSMAPSGSATARGGFVGMSLTTTRAQLIRSVFEGVAHNLAWLLGHVEAFTGETIAELRLTGGGAEVAGWPQVLADVLDRPVRVLPEPSLAVARAAALRALTRVTEVPVDPAADVASVERLMPDRAARTMYDHHQLAFEAAFDALRPVWQTLNR